MRPHGRHSAETFRTHPLARTALVLLLIVLTMQM
jgi:hypothetical protein